MKTLSLLFLLGAFVFTLVACALVLSWVARIYGMSITPEVTWNLLYALGVSLFWLLVTGVALNAGMRRPVKD